MANTYLILLLACFLLASSSEKLRGRGAHQQGTGSRAKNGANPTLDKVVMRRAIEELDIAKNAKMVAKASAQHAKAEQQVLMAKEAVVVTEPSYEKVKPMVPEARAQVLTIRKLLSATIMNLKHAKEVLAEAPHIPEIAAEQAVEATKGWIRADATASAEASSKVDNRLGRLTAAVAAAAEPYHLALLRNQKFCEETYAKAKSAHSSTVKLIDDAKKVALTAQGLQAAGEGIEARQTFAMASGMMDEAEKLRQWGQKMYVQANSACGEAGKYEQLEQQAAANTAATMIMNAPAPLPSVEDAYQPYNPPTPPPVAKPAGCR